MFILHWYTCKWFIIVIIFLHNFHILPSFLHFLHYFLLTFLPSCQSFSIHFILTLLYLVAGRYRQRLLREERSSRKLHCWILRLLCDGGSWYVRTCCTALHSTQLYSIPLHSILLYSSLLKYFHPLIFLLFYSLLFNSYIFSDNYFVEAYPEIFHQSLKPIFEIMKIPFSGKKKKNLI